MKTFLTLLLFGISITAATAQYAPEPDFKAEFRAHMLTPTEKPKLSFEQRDVLHTNIAGGILATVGIPVVVASAIHFEGNPALAGTGLFFGGLATAGAVALHTIGIKKLVKYAKEGKLNDAFVE